MLLWEGGRPLDVWEVLSQSGAICPIIWVIDVVGNALHTKGNGDYT